MRIGLSLTTLEPAISAGKMDGIGMYTKNLYEALMRRNETITPFSFPNTKEKLTPTFPNGQLLKYSYSLSTLGSLLLQKSMQNNLKQSIDLFHATDHMIPRVDDIPLIATIHDAIMFQHPEWHRLRFGKIKKMIRKRSFRWPDRYITISKAMVSEIAEYGNLDPEKIDVIYHGVAPEWFIEATSDNKAEIRKKYSLPEQFLLFASTLQEKKNLPRLVEAYLQLPHDLQQEYPLIIVGRPGWGNEASTAAVDKILSQKKGQWLNYVPYDDLRTLFQCAALYLHPSLHEGFGLTILEAFASQTPVITSRVAALPEIAGDAAVLIDPLSTTEITTAIKHLLLNPTLQEQYIQKGIERAKQFSWDKCAEETIKVYQKAL
jgi:glycosyltransferase involved in cell wall biosynthesis